MARGAQAQDSELQQSFNMALDAIKYNVGKVADEMVKESSRYTHYVEKYAQENLQIYGETADDTLELGKQMYNAYNALTSRLRIGFDIF